jgi:hypothetical protein
LPPLLLLHNTRLTVPTTTASGGDSPGPSGIAQKQHRDHSGPRNDASTQHPARTARRGTRRGSDLIRISDRPKIIALARQLYKVKRKARRLNWSRVMSILTNPLFWDKKIRIGLLTLATFAALC